MAGHRLWASFDRAMMGRQASCRQLILCELSRQMIAYEGASAYRRQMLFDMEDT